MSIKQEQKGIEFVVTIKGAWVDENTDAGQAEELMTMYVKKMLNYDEERSK